jgi:hypothetical protein
LRFAGFELVAGREPPFKDVRFGGRHEFDALCKSQKVSCSLHTEQFFGTQSIRVITANVSFYAGLVHIRAKIRRPKFRANCDEHSSMALRDLNRLGAEEVAFSSPAARFPTRGVSEYVC